MKIIKFPALTKPVKSDYIRNTIDSKTIIITDPESIKIIKSDPDCIRFATTIVIGNNLTPMPNTVKHALIEANDMCFNTAIIIGCEKFGANEISEDEITI